MNSDEDRRNYFWTAYSCNCTCGKKVRTVPQMKCDVKVTMIYEKSYEIYFMSDKIDATYFSQFGTLYDHSQKNSYVLYVDQRFDFQEVVEYIKSFE